MRCYPDIILMCSRYNSGAPIGIGYNTGLGIDPTAVWALLTETTISYDPSLLPVLIAFHVHQLLCSPIRARYYAVHLTQNSYYLRPHKHTSFN